MTDRTATFLPGQRVEHSEFGQGIVVESSRSGVVRAFFEIGERQVPAVSLRLALSPNQRVLAGVEGTPERLRRVWLSHEAHALPLMESAAALTAAKIDLLPHQIVLTHRIATGSPRRWLIADEVGLGKTIETALILRELASHGELERALIVVPAGLVNNWHRELNEVFGLNFEVFGSEGDVTDRRSNAFAKHNRLIASIDTLKRPARVKRLLDAPRWDLVVFDEAHHLTAYRSGGKVKKTENYKLAEALKGHSRDYLLLSATPHQGDHFRFWMLIQVLDPTLFDGPEDMVQQRHRLNSVVFRRTKADACRPDGSQLFARRWVHTESFLMGADERRFYAELRSYLEDGFALARRQGQQGRGLGFVMAIFQKIAASSFAAVARTLRRRLLMLTVHEAILKDRDLDIDGRQHLNDEARRLIQQEYVLADDRIGQAEADRILVDLRLKLLRRLDAEALELGADVFEGERAAGTAEELAVEAVGAALPEERQRIMALLAEFPDERETKAEKLLGALGTLWSQNPEEKVVVFATYLGTVDMIWREIDAQFPGQGVVVLKGGDHGSKVAAERRFRQPDGPRVLVCTAAGREGINLQFARILFNFDLPWNPMDVEQRIGRIHRYGQHHTAQVYNLVLSDTIEGRIFLLLEDKIESIASALGKVDEQGHVAEDLRSQILGQLAERLSYDRLYQEALSDPELRRTQLELDAALSNATEARKVVFELFQDLEGFCLEDYRPFANVEPANQRLLTFVTRALKEREMSVVPQDGKVFLVRDARGADVLTFTADRGVAMASESLQLLGLDMPLVQEELVRWQSLPAEERGVAIQAHDGAPAVLTWWLVESHGRGGKTSRTLLPIACSPGGLRLPTLERRDGHVFDGAPGDPSLDQDSRMSLLSQVIEPMLERELLQQGVMGEDSALSTRLVGWAESK